LTVRKIKYLKNKDIGLAKKFLALPFPFVFTSYPFSSRIAGGTATPTDENALPQVPVHSVLSASVLLLSLRITSCRDFKSCLISAHSKE